MAYEKSQNSNLELLYVVDSTASSALAAAAGGVIGYTLSGLKKKRSPTRSMGSRHPLDWNLGSNSTLGPI